MPFTIMLDFATEPDLAAFLQRILPRVRGQQADTPAPADEGDGPRLFRTGLTVTSQSAARELCHLLVSFLAHSKTGRISLEWRGVDGQPHRGVVEGGSAREAEILAVRLGAAAKAHLDQEKSEDAPPEQRPAAAEQG